MNEEGIKVSARPILVLTCFSYISVTEKKTSIKSRLCLMFSKDFVKRRISVSPVSCSNTSYSEDCLIIK